MFLLGLEDVERFLLAFPLTISFGTMFGYSSVPTTTSINHVSHEDCKPDGSRGIRVDYFTVWSEREVIYFN
jgi:hypothetical protein